MKTTRTVPLFLTMSLVATLSVADVRVTVHESPRDRQRSARSLQEALGSFTIDRIEVMDASKGNGEADFKRRIEEEVKSLLLQGHSPGSLPAYYGSPEWRAIVITSQGPSFFVERWSVVRQVIFGNEEWIVPVEGSQK